MGAHCRALGIDFLRSRHVHCASRRHRVTGPWARRPGNPEEQVKRYHMEHYGSDSFHSSGARWDVCELRSGDWYLVASFLREEDAAAYCAMMESAEPLMVPVNLEEFHEAWVKVYNQGIVYLDKHDMIDS